jgi:RNA polymerase sigma-70 factor, ECF subfamily
MTEPHREALEARLRELISARDLRKAIELALVGTGELTGYGNELFSFLLKELQDQEEAKEVFSSFAQDVCSSLEKFRMESSFRTWAYTLLKRALYRHRKDLKNLSPQRSPASAEISEVRIAIADDGTISISMIPSDTTSASGYLRKKEELERLNQLRQKLKKPDQDLLRLVIDKEMSFEEIAQKLSKRGEAITAETLRQRYHRVQEKLRKLLEEET